MASHLRVERVLALVPDLDEFQPLADAVIGSSLADSSKVWDSSSPYATVGKRLVEPTRLEALLPELSARAQQRLERLYTRVLEAIREQEAGNPAGAADKLIEAGELEESARRLAQAERLYSMALEIAGDLREKRPQIVALRRLGRVCRASGRLEAAWGWYDQSYTLSVDQMDLPGQAIACQGLGNLCDDRGQRELSREWYERGLGLAEHLDDAELVWPFYTNLAVVALKSDQLDQAETMLAKALGYIETARSASGMCFWYNGRGLLLTARNDPAGAEVLYREAIERVDNPFWEMTLGLNLGQALMKQDRLLEATDEVRKAEEIAITQRFIPYLVDVYSLLGEIARAKCDENGFIFYEQALEVCQERNLPDVHRAGVYHGYGLLHRACGYTDEAIAYLEQARAIYQALGLSAELRRVTADMAAVPFEPKPAV